ncbi:hypothetical protein OsJ_29822 [Oryza sativa Japonica Group]|uniref:Uncharacterized protein n=1 Tax=Oryza sativa subsp. japonica TaxID=39947 RepID=B9G497_ORYSJ|nr:hypothetical protein OsJ_29822 [Oryza sativa Japonica Group]
MGFCMVVLLQIWKLQWHGYHVRSSLLVDAPCSSVPDVQATGRHELLLPALHRHQHLQCALLQVDAHLDGMVETRKEHEKIMPVVMVPLEWHPRHVLRQRSSPAANTKGQPRTTTPQLMTGFGGRRCDALWIVLFFWVPGVYVFVTMMARSIVKTKSIIPVFVQ